MKNCKPLGIVTQKFIPEYYEQFDWNGIWNRKLESGTAFEWTVFSALINTIKEHGGAVIIPLLDYYNAGDFFILRNEIPLTHGAQAGNSATALSSKELKYRFLYSLVPKAIISYKGKEYSIFREGCPYHKIMCGQDYLERTDIMIMPGRPTSGYPKFNSSENEVLFSYDYTAQTVSGVLRIRNSPLIPCRMRNPQENINLNPMGIIECSVNKTAEVATEQLMRYNALFSNDAYHPAFSLITGNNLSDLPYDTHQIHLDDDNTDKLLSELKQASLGMLKHFSIIEQ